MLSTNKLTKYRDSYKYLQRCVYRKDYRHMYRKKIKRQTNEEELLKENNKQGSASQLG